MPLSLHTFDDRLMYALNRDISLLLPFKWSRSLWYITIIVTTIVMTSMSILLVLSRLSSPWSQWHNLDLNLKPELHFLCEPHQRWYWSCSSYQSFYRSLPWSRNLYLGISLSVNHIVDTWTHILWLAYAQPSDKYAHSHS